MVSLDKTPPTNDVLSLGNPRSWGQTYLVSSPFSEWRRIQALVNRCTVHSAGALFTQLMHCRLLFSISIQCGLLRIDEVACFINNWHPQCQALNLNPTTYNTNLTNWMKWNFFVHFFCLLLFSIFGYYQLWFQTSQFSPTLIMFAEAISYTCLSNKYSFLFYLGLWKARAELWSTPTLPSHMWSRS